MVVVGRKSLEKKDRMERYLEWLLVPKQERIPQTMEEVAVEMDVDVSTLKRYRSDPWLQSEFDRRLGAERVHRQVDIINELMSIVMSEESADRDKIAAGKTLLTYFDKSVFKVEHKKALTELTDAELDALLTND